MTHRRRRLFAFMLACVLWGSLGVTCEDFVSDPSEAENPAQLRLEVVDTYAFFAGTYVAVVDIVIVVDAPVQAIDMGISWGGPAVSVATAIPHAEFDDDGKLFSTGVQGDDSLTGITDLRHGAPVAQTLFRAARVALLVQSASEQIELRASGEIAGPDGSIYEVVISEFTTIAAPLP